MPVGGVQVGRGSIPLRWRITRAGVRSVVLPDPQRNRGERRGKFSFPRDENWF